MAKKYLLGNHAIAYGVLEGGVEGVFAYPGTPSSEITQKLIELSREHGFYAEWSINEKVAFENAYGVSLTGRRAAVIMKHVGLNVASDAFMTSAYTGIKGGLLVIVADDPFAHSSQNEQDTRRYALFAKVPCLEPSSIQEAKEMASFAFSFSEKTGLPVILRSVTRISHAKSDIEISNMVLQRRETVFEKNPAKLVMVPANARTALKDLNEKQKMVQKEMEQIPFTLREDGNATGIIAAGVSYQYAKEVKDKNRLPFSLMKISSYPPPPEKLSDFIKDKERVFIMEEGDPVIEEHVNIIARKINPQIDIKGKNDQSLPSEGEFSIETVQKALSAVYPETKKEAVQKPSALPSRPPVLCPGCSHLGSFYILKKVFGKDSIFSGDIGCYTLGIQVGTIDTCLCMGGGVNTGSGISLFEKNRNVVSVIGDSTFFHSGITGLINACYNKADMIIALLDNRTTAMTGHQPHPGTGETACGEASVNIDVEKLAYVCGASKVAVIDPYMVNESIEKLKELKSAKGVRVVIARRGCIFVEKKKLGMFTVDTEKCTGCKLCMQIKCPAITFSEEKARITYLCNGCGICSEICPFGAIIKENENEKR